MPRSDSAGPGARDGSGLPRADRPDPKRPDSLAVARAAGRRADQAREPEAPRPSKRRHGIGCAPACCRGSTSHGRVRVRSNSGIHYNFGYFGAFTHFGAFTTSPFYKLDAFTNFGA